MKFSKRASLEVGISTIVILVIAMVLIGGGIAFIRGFLDKGTKSLGQAFDITDFTIQPDAQTSMVFAHGDTLNLKKGKRETVKIGVYNRLGSDREFSFTITECISPTGGTITQPPNTKPIMEALPSNKVPAGEGKVFNVFVYGEGLINGARTDLVQGAYLCKVTTNLLVSGTINVESVYATADYVIEVFV